MKGDAKKAKRSSSKRRYDLISYGFVLPFMLVFFIFTVAPVVVSIVMSFTNFNMLQFPPAWVGVQNYIHLLFQDDIFKIAFKNTLFIALVTGPIGYILSFVFAWLINGLNRTMRTIMTLFYYAPSIVGNMAVIWAMIFSNDEYGLLNGFLLNTGILSEPVLWLSDTTVIMPVVILVILWSSLGTSFLAFIAGLQNMDRNLLEAGAIDGIHNRWQELYYIILPGMKPQLMFGAVMSISSSFGVGGVITGLVGNPSVDYIAHTLVHHLEDYGSTRYQMGYASAIATILFLIMILCNKLVQKIIARLGS